MLVYKPQNVKEALEHFKHVIKICPNRGHVLQNKLRTAMLKIFTKSLLKKTDFF